MSLAHQRIPSRTKRLPRVSMSSTSTLVARFDTASAAEDLSTSPPKRSFAVVSANEPPTAPKHVSDKLGLATEKSADLQYRHSLGHQLCLPMDPGEYWYWNSRTTPGLAKCATVSTQG
jgi:hypothetical protein